MNFKVMKEPCDQCLFTDNAVVSNERRKEIIQSTVSSSSYFEFHKASIAGTNHCCRNFYDRLGDYSQSIRISQRLGVIEFSLPEDEKS